MFHLFQIHPFALTINLVSHFFQYSLTSSLIQIVIYLNIDFYICLKFLIFTLNVTKNFALLQTSLPLFHGVLLKIYIHLSCLRGLHSPNYTKSEIPQIIDAPQKDCFRIFDYIYL
jgi:hypothetical protein